MTTTKSTAVTVLQIKALQARVLKAGQNVYTQPKVRVVEPATVKLARKVARQYDNEQRRKWMMKRLAIQKRQAGVMKLVLFGDMDKALKAVEAFEKEMGVKS